MTLQERVECGSPAKWTRIHLPKALIADFFIHLCPIIFPIFGQICELIIMILLCPRRTYGSKDNGSKETDSFSADYGNGDTRACKTNKVFCIVYSAIWIAICATCIALFYNWGESKGYEGNDKIAAIILLITLSCSMFLITVSQILTVVTFKYRIREYACPKCFHANTMLFEGVEGRRVWKNESFVGSTGGGQHRTHTVYADGKEVGGIYASDPVYNHYVTTKHTEEKRKFKCSRCGHSFMRYVEIGTQKVGERSVRNNK